VGIGDPRQFFSRRQHGQSADICGLFTGNEPSNSWLTVRQPARPAVGLLQPGTTRRRVYGVAKPTSRWGRYALRRRLGPFHEELDQSDDLGTARLDQRRRGDQLGFILIFEDSGGPFLMQTCGAGWSCWAWALLTCKASPNGWRVDRACVWWQPADSALFDRPRRTGSLGACCLPRPS
jgi:hypothetical protein